MKSCIYILILTCLIKVALIVSPLLNFALFFESAFGLWVKIVFKTVIFSLNALRVYVSLEKSTISLLNSLLTVL